MKVCRISPQFYSQMLDESYGPKANPLFSLVRPGKVTPADDPDTMVVGLQIEAKRTKSVLDAARFDPVISGTSFGS